MSLENKFRNEWLLKPPTVSVLNTYESTKKLKFFKRYLVSEVMLANSKQRCIKRYFNKQDLIPMARLYYISYNIGLKTI